MMNAFPVGDVLTPGQTVQWRIPNFLDYPKLPSTTLLSPIFLFNGEMGILKLTPNSLSNHPIEGWFELKCELYSHNSVIKCSILDHWGRKMLTAKMQEIASEKFLKERWFDYSELMVLSEEVLKYGELHIVCTVLPETNEDAEESEFDALEVFEANSDEEKDSSSHATNEDLDELSQNLKNMYSGGVDCDVSIKVKDVIFNAHRLILKARSPAFNAMLSHDMIEKISGVICIEDCDPKIFGDFLIYIYSGKVQNLTSDNMCGLYRLADKYDLPYLKKQCLSFMESSLSVKWISDVMWLAETYEEFELMVHSMVFFINNAEEIINTKKWILFMEENSTLAYTVMQQTSKVYKHFFK